MKKTFVFFLVSILSALLSLPAAASTGTLQTIVGGACQPDQRSDWGGMPSSDLTFTQTDLVLLGGTTDYALSRMGARAEAGSMDTATTIFDDGEALIPFRFVVEELGGKVRWDEIHREVSGAYGSHQAKIWPGSPKWELDGQLWPTYETRLGLGVLPVRPPLIVSSGRTVVPVSVIARFLDATVDVDTCMQVVTVTVRTP